MIIWIAVTSTGHAHPAVVGAIKEQAGDLIHFSASDFYLPIYAETCQRIAEITAEQTRIRENMKTVSQTTQYYERLLAKLNEQESSIESLQKERDSLTQKRDSLRKDLEDYLNGLTLG